MYVCVLLEMKASIGPSEKVIYTYPAWNRNEEAFLHQYKDTLRPSCSLLQPNSKCLVDIIQQARITILTEER